VSVPGGKYPNPYAVFMIAMEFGLAGWDGHSQDPPADWLVDINQSEHCIVVAQLWPGGNGCAS
jgi:hypothetical protein